jgi:CHAT domain-containing protein
MPVFRFQGRVDAATEPPVFASVLGRGEIRAKASASLQAARGDQAPEALDLAPDDGVELELPGGLRLWTRADDLARDFGLGDARAGGDGSVELPTHLPVGRRARDGAGIPISAIRTFEIVLPGAIRDLITGRVERGLEPGGSLLQCSPTSAAAFEPPRRLSGNSPVLVFLHGTASSTEGSFSGLWEAVGANRILRIVNPGARINDLFELYERRILAFQHRSLTESPVTNALALATQLASIVGDGAELHLVSHSRGGMIGELLARAMREDGAIFDTLDYKRFGAGRPEPAELEELGALLKKLRPRITRFVRVACPAAGTTLADGRLDRYFSVLVNAARLLPGLAANPLYESLTTILAAVIKERTNPETLPGLEAMMPTSPLARILNRRDIRVQADLHVLGGDLAPAGFFGTLKALATDLYYRDDHDLVVHTPSMLGGAARTNGVKYWIDTGGEVTHFNYFERADTAGRLYDALRKDPKADYYDLEVPPAAVTSEDYRKRAADAQPILFVVPTCFGSHLKRGGRVWMDSASLAQGSLALLAGGQPAEPDALVGAYAPLIEHLSGTHDVEPVPNDWRLSLKANAQALQLAIERKIASAPKSGLPVRILAHGAGGLIVLQMLSTDEGRAAWTRYFQHADSRLVFLGLPADGTWAITALITGRSALTQGLALVDLAHDEADIIRLLAGFDGLLELLPEAANGDGPFSAAWWQARKAVDAAAGVAVDWPLPDGAKLARALEVRRGLREAALDPARMTCVAGRSDLTPTGIADTFPGEGARGGLRGSDQGDGVALWSTSIPDALRPGSWLMDGSSWELVSSTAGFPTLTELLTSGSTTKLGRAPAPARGEVGVQPIAVRSLAHIPGDAEIVASTLSSTARVTRASARPKVRVRVVHDNLSRAADPVVVGHYRDDVFISAEAFLDRKLDGRLTELHRMELYPARIESAVAVTNDPESVRKGVHPGAIVVGLGNVGELTPGALLRTLAHGLTLYASERVGQVRRQWQREGTPLQPRPSIVETPVAALLVGSGEGGVSLADSVQALLRAIVRANQRLGLDNEADGGGGTAGGTRAFISSLDLYELYEDRAIEAVHVLDSLSTAAEFRESFIVEARLEVGGEGRRRASFDERPLWWQRIRITEAPVDPCDKDTSVRMLRFEALTDRARADAFSAGGQRALADQFVRRAMASTTADQTIGQTLFEVLVPNEMKEQAPDRRKLVLVLDEQTATLPWELLHDRFDRGARPIAVEAGIVRQLMASAATHERPLRAAEPTALVIGDPKVTDPRFPSLGGARREAGAAAQRLTMAGYDVDELMGPGADPRLVLSALHARPWRILHIAAHGVFEFEIQPGRKVTGVVLDDGMILGPADFQQMRTIPDLVFLNCCHLGNPSPGVTRPVVPFPQLAANVAVQFIKRGARAVVAAGWAVDDGAAGLFADVFYELMLDGVQFGDAVQRARAEVHRTVLRSNTWGAYQCYGDPGFTLKRGPTGGAPRTMVSATELCLKASAIGRNAKVDGSSAHRELKDELEKLVTAAAPAWLQQSRVCAEIASAYGELGDYEKAVQYYQRARSLEDGTISLRDLEQLANLKSRNAERRWRKAASGGSAPAAGEAPQAMVADAITLLDALVAVAPTAERLALLGAAHKRSAMLASSLDARRKALVDMGEAYRRSYARKVQAADRDPWYPLLNQMTAQVAAELLTRRKSAEQAEAAATKIEEGLATLGTLAEAVSPRATDFWTLCFPVEADVLRHLWRRTLSDDLATALAGRYQSAVARGGSVRELDSVATQLQFLEDLVRASPDAAVRALAEHLRRLRDALRDT